jgi:hypothetical protein
VTNYVLFAGDATGAVWDVGKWDEVTWDDVVITGGSYAFTGTAATLSAAYKLNFDSGNYSFNGTNATLTGARLLSAASGNYSFSGTAATLYSDFSLTAGSGSFSFTGKDASLLGNVSFEVSSGFYTFTEFPAGLIVRSSKHGGDDAPPKKKKKDNDTITRGELYQLELAEQEARLNKKTKQKKDRAEALAKVEFEKAKISFAREMLSNDEAKILLFDNELRREIVKLWLQA